MAKFKVGDKVIGNKNADFRYPFTGTGWKGVVTRVKNDGSFKAEGQGNSRDNSVFDSLDPRCFDLISEKKELVKDIKYFIVHCPTRDLLERVIRKMKKDGLNKNFGGDINSGHSYGEGHCLRIAKGEYSGYSSLTYYRKEKEFENYTFLSAEEYLGIEPNKATYIAAYAYITTYINQPKQTIMETIRNGVLKFTKEVENTIKRILPEYKDLYRAGLIDGDLKETDAYDEVMLDIQREEYRTKVIEVAKERIAEAEKVEAEKKK